MGRVLEWSTASSHDGEENVSEGGKVGGNITNLPVGDFAQDVREFLVLRMSTESLKSIVVFENGDFDEMHVLPEIEVALNSPEKYAGVIPAAVFVQGLIEVINPLSDFLRCFLPERNEDDMQKT